MTADPPSRSEGPDPGLDVDAAFAEIVANWGPVAPVPPEELAGPPRAAEPPAQAPTPGPAAPVAPVEPVEPPERPGQRPGQRPGPRWEDPLQSAASWEDEGHFVPPAPPPLPSVEPRRRLAWTGLVGAPVLGMLLLLLGVVIPGWLSTFLVCAFVGGFCYLVATMGQHPHHDDWSGDDGAVL